MSENQRIKNQSLPLSASLFDRSCSSVCTSLRTRSCSSANITSSYDLCYHCQCPSSVESNQCFLVCSDIRRADPVVRIANVYRLVSGLTKYIMCTQYTEFPKVTCHIPRISKLNAIVTSKLKFDFAVFF
jgi:hypothetical protein